MWYNSNLRIDNKVLYIQSMIDKIEQVKHQLDENGDFLSVVSLKNKYQGTEIDYVTYYGIISLTKKKLEKK